MTETLAELKQAFEKLRGDTPHNKVVRVVEDEVTEKRTRLVRDETPEEAVARRAYNKQAEEVQRLQQFEQLLTNLFAESKSLYLAHLRADPTEMTPEAVRAWVEEAARLRGLMAESGERMGATGNRLSALRQWVDGNVPPMVPFTQVVTD
jgi:hypothetical protein